MKALIQKVLPVTMFLALNMGAASVASAAPGLPADELPWGPRGNAQPCAALKCSKEQNEAVKAVHTKMQATVAQARQSMHELKAQLAEVLRADTLDRSALDSIFSQLDTQREHISAARKEALAELHTIFTAEQRAKWADRVAKRAKKRSENGEKGEGHGKRSGKGHGKGHGKGKKADDAE